jgi:hypothetical protein
MKLSLEIDLNENPLPTYREIRKMISQSLDLYHNAVALEEPAAEDDTGVILDPDGKHSGGWRVTASGKDRPQPDFTLYFVHCKTEWNDDADSICNNRCPKCDREIEPYAVSDNDGNLTLQVIAASFQPEGGLPDGVADVTDLLGWPPTTA